MTPSPRPNPSMSNFPDEKMTAPSGSWALVWPQNVVVVVELHVVSRWRRNWAVADHVHASVEGGLTRVIIKIC